MKKLITIMCVAAAPILFAQEKAMKSNTQKKATVEQQAKIEKKETANKVKADNAKKKAEIKANQNNNKNVSREATLEAHPVKAEKK